MSPSAAYPGRHRIVTGILRREPNVDFQISNLSQYFSVKHFICHCEGGILAGIGRMLVIEPPLAPDKLLTEKY